jgi:chaperonin GroES
MSKINLKPLADRVIIEPMAAETKTASGIYIPDTAQEKPQRGKIVAVGSGTKDEVMVIKVGNIVLYGKYAGTEIVIQNDKFLIMRQSDILAIEEQPNKK